jgi:hypothetical protein
LVVYGRLLIVGRMPTARLLKLMTWGSVMAPVRGHAATFCHRVAWVSSGQRTRSSAGRKGAPVASLSGTAHPDEPYRTAAERHMLRPVMVLIEVGLRDRTGVVSDQLSNERPVAAH